MNQKPTGREAVRMFVQEIQRDPELYERTMNRPVDKLATLTDGLDYVVQIAEERGYTFSHEDLASALSEALPEAPSETIDSSGLAQLLVGQAITTGTMGFKSLKVGLSNPTLVMCQYHAPMAVLAEKSINERMNEG
jgi:hypothetical protein